jgi:hypothetical protein
MPDGPGKRERKAALKAWKAAERVAARARFPLPPDRLKALFDTLDVELPRLACDHSLRLVRAWCARHHVDPAPVEAWLHENGGHCDCEALFNAEQAFEDAMHDA